MFKFHSTMLQGQMPLKQAKNALSKIPGIERLKPILAVNRSGGKNYIDMYGKLDFGSDGFCSSSSDVNLNDYIT